MELSKDEKNLGAGRGKIEEKEGRVEEGGSSGFSKEEEEVPAAQG